MHCILHVGWTNFNFSVKSPNKVICLRMRIIHIRENKFSYPDLNLEKLYGTSGSVSRIDIPTLLRVSMKQNLPFFLNLINIILYYSTYLKKKLNIKSLCVSCFVILYKFFCTDPLSVQDTNADLDYLLRFWIFVIL